MITIKEFEDNPSRYIWGNDCKIHIDSIFSEEFAGNLNLLVTCCEDKATPDGINYYQAVKDYNDQAD
jgi:hypothetical protein